MIPADDIRRLNTIVLLLSLVLYTSGLQCQETGSTELVSSRVEDIIQGSSMIQEAQTEGMETDIDNLLIMLDLNLATEDEVTAFPLFTEQQKIAFLSYRNSINQLLSIYELAQIEGFDTESIARMLPFLILSPVTKQYKRSVVDRIKNARHQLWLNLRHHSKRGSEDLEMPVYYGNPMRYSLKYTMHAGSSIRAGFRIIKDPGEMMIGRHFQTIWDNSSIYISLRISKVVKKLVVGDYNIQLGQGLNLSTGFSMSGGLDPSGIRRFSRGLLPSLSTNKNFRFRGIASSFKFSRVAVDVFFSNKNMDAIIYNDGKGDYFRNFVESGYYRNEKEYESRNQVNQAVFGGHLCYHGKDFRLGVILHQAMHNMPRQPGAGVYDGYSWAGKQNSVAGAYFQKLLRHTAIFAEVSVDQRMKMAGLAGINFQPDPRVQFSALLRYYSLAYQNLFGSAYGINSMNSNEMAIYSGMTINMRNRFSLKVAADMARIPWVSYRRDFPSIVKRFWMRLDKGFAPGNSISFSILSKYYLLNHSEINIRNSASCNAYTMKLGLRFRISPFLRYQLNMYSRINVRDKMEPQQGFMQQHILSYHSLRGSLEVHFGFGMFEAEDYDTRIYAYAKGFYNELSFPAYYGVGGNVFCMMRYLYTKRLQLWLRFGRVIFNHPVTNDPEENELIKTEIKLQCLLNL